jgi:hypothetical protein
MRLFLSPIHPPTSDFIWLTHQHVSINDKIIARICVFTHPSKATLPTFLETCLRNSLQSLRRSMFCLYNRLYPDTNHFDSEDATRCPFESPVCPRGRRRKPSALCLSCALFVGFTERMHVCYSASSCNTSADCSWYWWWTLRQSSLCNFGVYQRNIFTNNQSIIRTFWILRWWLSGMEPLVQRQMFIIV